MRKEALSPGLGKAFRANRFQETFVASHRLDERRLESSPDPFDFVDVAEAKGEG